MTATAHALIAGAIASRFSDPFTAGLLALTSHYVLDSIPHWDFGTNWRNRPKIATGILAVIETATGVILSYIFFGRYISFALWAFTVLMSILPDWLETPWYIFYANPKKQRPDKQAGIIERIAYRLYSVPNVFHTKTQLPLGLATQIAAVTFFLLLLG